ncbi:MAG: AarF/UbiB family protein [Firmicutes bacterium]|jgi:ubiquinone biosynthesis protein|nr:AarF/UbiB family protein [Bacillota bacterium]
MLERRSPWAALYNFSGAVEEFARILQEELDFLLEAQNADHLRHNFDEQPGVRFPRVYHEYTTKWYSSWNSSKGRRSPRSSA